MDGMIWIHADDELKECRVLDLIQSADMQLKITQGSALVDNTWSMTIPEREWEKDPIQEGHFIYSPGTEWGGPVYLVKHATESGMITLQGPCWRGLLHQKRIYPPSGSAYLVFDNVDANEMIRQVVGNVFGSLVVVTSANAGVNVSASFRYDSIAAGIQNTLRNYNLRLVVTFDNASGHVVLSTAQTNDLTEVVEISQDYGIHFTSTAGNIELANHCLALGQGELTERLVLNVYNNGGTFATTRPDTMPESMIRTVLLDYPNAEDPNELYKKAVETLKKKARETGIRANNLQVSGAEMGDVISVRDRITGLTGTAEISNQILNISGGYTTIQVSVENVGGN